MQVNKVQNQNQYYFIVQCGNLFATAAKGQKKKKEKSEKFHIYVKVVTEDLHLVKDLLRDHTDHILLAFTVALNTC